MLTPATATGRSWPSTGNHRSPGHDPDEEVGREERPEDHDLGDDEKQHPEQLRLDARGAVGRRRAVVLVLGVGDRGGFHGAPYATASADSATSTCSTGLFVGAAHALDQVGAQPARARRRQGGDHDVVDAEELERVHGPPCTGRGRRSCPRRCSPAARARSIICVKPGARLARGDAVAALLGHDEDEDMALDAPRRAPCSARAGASAGGAVGDRERDAEGRPSWSRSTTTCSTGSRVASAMRSMRPRRSQPDDAAG